MKVQEVMTKDVEACTADSSLAVAAAIMWRNDCGVVPVVEETDRRVIGVITDRDICMACATRDRRPAEIRVGEVITGQVFSCTPRGEVKTALRTMAEQRVRRLPVVGPKGALVGMLSLNDIVLNAPRGGTKTTGAITPADVLEAYRSICERLQPAET
jgi:CBS domain-containing protein